MKTMEKDGIVPNKRFFLEALEVFRSRLPGSIEQEWTQLDRAGHEKVTKDLTVFVGISVSLLCMFSHCKE